MTDKIVEKLDIKEIFKEEDLRKSNNINSIGYDYESSWSEFFDYIGISSKFTKETDLDKYVSTFSNNEDKLEETQRINLAANIAILSIQKLGITMRFDEDGKYINAVTSNSDYIPIINIYNFRELVGSGESRENILGLFIFSVKEEFPDLVLNMNYKARKLFEEGIRTYADFISKDSAERVQKAK
jgi:hypothetical protein